MAVKLRIFCLILISSLIIIPIYQPQQASAVEIGHTFVEVTTRDTETTNTYSQCSGARLTDANLTDGSKYLIVVTAQIDHSDVAQSGFVRLVHGSTDFEGSEMITEQDSATIRAQYFWFTVWTAVASENVDLQIRTEAASGDTVGCDQVTMVAIKLSDLIENTDWFFNEVTTDVNPVQNLFADDTSTASVTFTPNGSNDWLVMATSTVNPITITQQLEMRINAGGGVTDTGVMWSQEGEDATNGQMVMTVAKVYTPTAVSTTFETETRIETTETAGNTKIYNSIFALNLNKFNQHAFQATQAEINLDTTDAFATSTNVATASLNPSVTGDVWALGFFIYDMGSSEYLRARLQTDNTDNPNTQTSDNYQQLDSWDNTDELGWAIQTIESMSSGSSHPADVDATKITTARPVEDRLVMLVTMELPSGAPTINIDQIDVFECLANCNNAGGFTTLESGNDICLNVDTDSPSTCSGTLITGHVYRVEIEVVETGGVNYIPTSFDIDSSVGNFDLAGNLVAGEIYDSGCQTNTNWSESIVSTDMRSSSGTTCTINSSTGEWWIVFKLDSDAGGGTNPTVTFTITDGSVSDTSASITFLVSSEG